MRRLKDYKGFHIYKDIAKPKKKPSPFDSPRISYYVYNKDELICVYSSLALAKQRINEYVNGDTSNFDRLINQMKWLRG